MKPLSDLVVEAAEGADTNSIISEAEAATLKELAKILREEHADNLETLRDRLSHYCD
jgi:hypothetical protein